MLIDFRAVYLRLCPVRTMLFAIPACDIRDHDELTGGSSGHVSVDLPQIGGREFGVGIAQNLATTLLTPISLPLSRWSTGPPRACPFSKSLSFKLN